MNKTNRSVPLIAVVEGGSADSASASQGAETFRVYSKKDAKLALSYADGIILTGGGDVNPARYGEKPHKEVYGTSEQRDKLEFWLVARARERGIPIMGICRGSQVLNVAHGGTLDQNIYDDKGTEDHWGTQLFVKVARRSRLARALGTHVMQSSHYHHQAVRTVGDGLRPIAWASDGTIEAVESDAKNPHYVLGVQFHPEMDYGWDKDAEKVFNFFVWDVAARFAHRRKKTAMERLSLIDKASPYRVRGRTSYDDGYTYGYGHQKTVADADWGKAYNAYLRGEVDDWEYQQWLELNSGQRFSSPEAATLSFCQVGSCATPEDCSRYQDCYADAVAHANADLILRREEEARVERTALALSEDEASDIIKQMNYRRGRGGRL
jgi:gamma-glutamyl-gamma-aminobutyrate hydrolase PuuD